MIDSFTSIFQNGQLADLGIFSQVFLVFIAGIATSLTPCVYPLIPVTLALFGADDNTKRTRAFSLSVTFVAGITFTFCSLGIFSATTGALFGSILSHPAVIVLLAGLMTILACSSLDLFQISIFTKLQSKASKVGAKGYLGAFLAGTVSGIVASPCVGPVLVAILIYVAKTGETFHGILLLFSFAQGMGVLFIILGTYSGLVSKIPRSGHWMNVVKFIMAIALLFYALFLLQPIFSIEGIVSIPKIPLSIFFLACAIVLTTAYFSYAKKIAFLKFGTAALLAIIIFVTFIATPTNHISTLVWNKSLSAALEIAKKEDKPLFIDLYADWCVACKELEKTTLEEPQVKSYLSQFVLARIDFTSPNKETERLTEKYQIIGLPWLFAINKEEKLIKGTTITGYIDAKEFLRQFKKIDLTAVEESR